MADFLGSNAPIFSARTGLIRVIMVILLSLMTNGCAIFTIDTMHNQPLEPAIAQKTRATEKVAADELYQGKFIGFALSGGGSRAANFSAAVMFELDDKLQVLDKATAISSVSGSSLTAAYYGLYGRDKSLWKLDEVRKQLKKDFEARWVGRWFLPQNALLYWSTNFSRSDIMKEVVDSNLFHGGTFANMSSGRPRILINSTTLARGEHFIFSEEMFGNKLNSRLDTYPVADAVMASSAFPGAFHDKTLFDFTKQKNPPQKKKYAHVIDGGPFDNLGVITLLDMVDQLQNKSDRSSQCFLFVVDAYPFPIKDQFIHKADTRKFIDYFVDSNIVAASDALLTVRRSDLLDQVNVDIGDDGMQIDPFHIKPDKELIYLDNGHQVNCGVWHISLQRLLSSDFQKFVIQAGVAKKDIDDLAKEVNSIPTRYKLTWEDEKGNSIKPDTLQNDLFKAAYYLINYDKDEDGKPILGQVREWLNN
jgi:predicted acylesterase/phospholipase RssA